MVTFFHEPKVLHNTFLKSKQNITRDIEIKNNLTVTGGEVGGDNGGEGFSGTAIKDRWEKPRRRVEAREGEGFGWGGGKWWGVSADNCNCTTIK